MPLDWDASTPVRDPIVWASEAPALVTDAVGRLTFKVGGHLIPSAINSDGHLDFAQDPSARVALGGLEGFALGVLKELLGIEIRPDLIVGNRAFGMVGQDETGRALIANNFGAWRSWNDDPDGRFKYSDPLSPPVWGGPFGRLFNAFNHQEGVTPDDTLDIFSPYEPSIVQPAATVVESISQLDEYISFGRRLIMVDQVATANIDLGSGVPPTIDGAATNPGRLYLLAGQTEQTENGIYTPLMGSLVRPSGFDETWEVLPGTLVVVQQGADKGNTIWQMDGLTAPSIGATDITFTELPVGGGGGGGTITQHTLQFHFISAINPSANITSLDLKTLDTTNKYYPPIPAAGTIVGIAFHSEGAHTAGDGTFEVTKNGTATGYAITAAAGDLNGHDESGGVAVSAGDRIGVQITTDGSWNGGGRWTVTVLVKVDEFP